MFIGSSRRVTLMISEQVMFVTSPKMIESGQGSINAKILEYRSIDSKGITIRLRMKLFVLAP